MAYCTDASIPDLFHHSLAGVTRILQIRVELFLMVDPLGRRRGAEAVVINLPVVIFLKVFHPTRKTEGSDASSKPPLLDTIQYNWILNNLCLYH